MDATSMLMKTNADLIKISCLIPDLPSPEQLLPYLNRIHRNRWYTNFGELSAEFQLRLIKQLEEKSSATKIAGCLSSSGTGALEVALLALNLKQDSQVLVPSLTFPATATAVIRSGLKPLISDVDPVRWQLTPKIAYRLIENHSVAAVMPVATFGMPVDIEAWDSFSRDTGIPVIVDAAGAFGFQRVGKYCLVAFSFHATKPMGIGEGGGVFSENEVLIDRIKTISNFGLNDSVVECLGCNAKLSEFHAAVGLAQLDRWREIVTKRSEINLYYDNLLSQYPKHIQQQQNINHDLPTVKVVKLSTSAAKISQQLSTYKIETRRWYCPALHFHPLFKQMGAIALDSDETFMRVANKLSDSVIGLPFHTFLTLQDVSRVVDTLKCLIDNENNSEGQHDDKK